MSLVFLGKVIFYPNAPVNAYFKRSPDMILEFKENIITKSTIEKPEISFPDKILEEKKSP